MTATFTSRCGVAIVTLPGSNYRVVYHKTAG
jgi:hypothetical protein